MNARKMIASVVLLGCVICFICSCGLFQKPKDVLKTFATAVKAKDWNAMWEHLSSGCQADFEKATFTPIKERIAKLTPEELKKVNPELGVSAEQVKSMDVKKFFGLFMEKSGVGEQMSKLIDPAKMNIEKEVTGKNDASIKIKDMPKEIKFVKEKGVWKVDLRG